MRIGSRVLCCLCASVMLVCSCVAVTAEENTSASQALIERAVMSYAAYGEQDAQAMEALAADDPALAEKWSRIMDLWKAPVSVNEALPDDLPGDDTLCLVALGFQLNPDGTMRDELVERLKVLLAASEKYPRAVIVCTGGGTAANDPAATEAGRMAEWLYDQGVDPSRVYVEDKSVTTAQNAIYTFDILAERCPQVAQIAIISSDYHIATGTLLFGAEAILRDSPVTVTANAAWNAPSGTLSVMFQAGALIELSGDMETAFEIYYETYDIHELPPLPDAAGSMPESAVPAAAAPVGYMPGVTEEMTVPAFWSDLAGDPDAVLATTEDIDRINKAAVAGEGTNRRDMKNLKETYNGIAKNEALRESTQNDVDYYLGWVWDQTGKKMTQEDFDPIIANCLDPNAAEEMPVRWGIAVNRTELIAFPWDGQILDDPLDFDFDYQPLVGIRVNEPVAIYSTSADGKFFQVSTSCCTGWVRAEDIAVCRDKEEWLSAWDIPAEKRLVFWGDKMYTDYSNTAADTVCRLITMGTVLERMDETDPDALVINRLPLHNYAVYLPVRKKDGSYGKTPALVNARERVSEDYLPLTARNLAMVALASLGDAYGWGAGLNNEDCSSLNHSIFCCFGLDLPRNGTWQWLMDFPKAEIANYTLEEKEALLDALPMGTLLNFPGHQMMYLGKYAGSYYVVSTVSSIMSPWSGTRQRTRDVQINTLDIRRANGKTWMQALNKVYIPWLYLNEGEESALSQLPAYHEATAFCLEKGLMDAFPTGYFLPKRAATVAEGVQMLWRIAGKPEPDMSQEGFADVAAGSENEKAALWAKQTGVYTGLDGSFRAGAGLTWSEIRSMAETFVCEDVIGERPDEGAPMTRADLAGVARPVSEAWDARHPVMPSDPFGAAGTNAPYFARPCNERLASLPEALMKMAKDGYSWEYEYVADKPAYALTLMDYANIYSFIHTHDLDRDALREVLSDADRMVHRRAFTEEEIDLLLGDDQAAAMAHFASPSTIVIGEKGYSEKWMYDHPIEDWAAEGITPDMVIAVQENYYNPLFTREAAKAFSRKLYAFTGILTPVRLSQWEAGEVKPDGSVAGETEGNGVMLDVIEFCQYPDYPTGCESVSLYMLLKYYGVDVTVDQIYDLLPMGDQPYEDKAGVRHGANPEQEFVGDPRSEYSYGVFNEPVARVAEQIMPGVKTKTGASLEDIKAILDTGNPVLAWYVSAPMREIMYRWSWVDKNNETVHWPGGEHAVVICGYDDHSVTYRDPNAGTTVVIDEATFLKSFNELGGRIVYYPVQ